MEGREKKGLWNIHNKKIRNENSLLIVNQWKTSSYNPRTLDCHVRNSHIFLPFFQELLNLRKISAAFSSWNVLSLKIVSREVVVFAFSTFHHHLAISCRYPLPLRASTYFGIWSCTRPWNNLSNQEAQKFSFSLLSICQLLVSPGSFQVYKSLEYFKPPKNTNFVDWYCI